LGKITEKKLNSDDQTPTILIKLVQFPAMADLGFDAWGAPTISKRL